jgi:multisubunit Na+/H+ antiporter MnhE subunit
MILAILSTFGFLFLLEKVSSKSWLLAFIISVISAVLLLFFFQNSMVYSPVIPLVAQHS